MAVSLLDNFDYAGKKPNFARDLFDSLADMIAYSENYLPDVFEANCKDTGKRYRYNVNNTEMEGLGKWREITSGSGGATSYTELTDKPKINDVELTGEMALSDLGIVQSDWAEDDDTKFSYIVNKPTITAVEANPEAESTDTLSKVKIGDTVYKTDSSFSDAFTTSVTVGGVESGTTVAQGESVAALLKKVLAPMTGPTFTFTGSPAGGLVKKDTTVTAPTFTINVTALGANTSRSYAIKKGETEIVSATEITAVQSYTETTTDNVTEDTTFTCTVTYSDGTETKTKDATVKYEFVNPLFYGIVESNSPDAETVAALTERLAKSAGFTWSGITMTNKYLCYAYPATMADLTSIKDVNGFTVTDSFQQSTVEINSVSYKVYTTKESSSLTSGKMIFA